MEKTPEAYSPHRYLDENGAPDYMKIFSVIESPLKRHVDDWLLAHLENQPEIVRKAVDKHFDSCSGCRDRFEVQKAGGQI